MKSPCRMENRPVKSLSIQELPPLTFHEWDVCPPQIAAYLRKLMETVQAPEGLDCIVIPSVMDLAVQFHCCEMDIFDALFELKQQAYHYKILSIDTPIELSDPLLRKPTNLDRWKPLSRETHSTPIPQHRYAT